MVPLDRLAETSRWRTLPLTERLLLALGLLTLALIVPPWPGDGMVLICAATLAMGSAAIPPSAWIGAFAAPGAFILTGAATLLVAWGADGPELATGGLQAAAGVCLRSGAAVSALLLLALTTPAPELVQAARRLGLPAELAELTLITWRFLFILAGTAQTMQAAQAARLGYDGPRRSLRSAGMLAAALLPQALDRAHRLERGLAARGFDGSLPMLSPHRPAQPLRLALIGAGLVTLGGTALWLS